MAIGAVKSPFEQHAHGDSQAVAAEKGPGITVLRAALSRQYRGEAQWATRLRCEEPLGNDHAQREDSAADGDPRQPVVINRDRIEQDSSSRYGE